MTTRMQRYLFATCAAAGFALAGTAAQATELDVSSIYGRASPPLTSITGGHFESPTHFGKVEETTAPVVTASQAADPDYSESAPVVTSESDAVTPATASQSIAETSQGEYLTTPATAAAAPDTVVTPTGKYLPVDDPVYTDGDATAMRDESLDGVPLVDGRGMRDDVDYVIVEPVYSDPVFNVADVMGRSSPPAPAEISQAEGPDFGRG